MTENYGVRIFERQELENLTESDELHVREVRLGFVLVIDAAYHADGDSVLIMAGGMRQLCALFAAGLEPTVPPDDVIISDARKSAGAMPKVDFGGADILRRARRGAMNRDELDHRITPPSA